MNDAIDFIVLCTLAGRTFRLTVESPIAYIVAFFFYLFVGALFGSNYFAVGQASVTGIAQLAPWALWFVVPALTMGLFSEELRSGTFEQLATLPIRDWEIVLGKFLGFAALAAVLIAGLAFYPLIVALTRAPGQPFDWSGSIGILAALFLLSATYGAIGLFASSLAKNQVVALIIGVMICTFFFFIGQFSSLMPTALARPADFIGVLSHLETVSRGVWDLRDLLYFGSISLLFLYLTVQRLTTRRF